MQQLISDNQPPNSNSKPPALPRKNKLPPKVEMMPSLRKKQDSNFKHQRAIRMMDRFPKIALVEIGLFLCSERFKVAMKYMRICKAIYKHCSDTQIFWYLLYLQKYPTEFIKQYYVPIVGDNKQLQGHLTKEQALEYLRPKQEDFFIFHGQIKSLNWKEIF